MLNACDGSEDHQGHAGDYLLVSPDEKTRRVKQVNTLIHQECSWTMTFLILSLRKRMSERALELLKHCLHSNSSPCIGLIQYGTSNS
jgi:hypothetical protein